MTRSERDFSPESQLSRGAGEIWVAFRLSEDEEADSKLTENLTAFVEDNKIGEWTGQSVGSGQRDITFEVESMRGAAERIRAYFSQEASPRDFWISTDYETLFDQQ